MKRLLKALVPDMLDVTAFGGVGLMSYGAWRIYEPAGFLTAGALLLVLTLLRAKAQGANSG